MFPFWREIYLGFTGRVDGVEGEEGTQRALPEFVAVDAIYGLNKVCSEVLNSLGNRGDRQERESDDNLSTHNGKWRWNLFI